MMGAPGAKAKDARKTLKTLLHYLQPYRVKIIIVMIFAALSSIFSIVGPKLLGNVTTKLAEGLIAYYLGTGLYMDFAYMGRLIVLLIILYADLHGVFLRARLSSCPAFPWRSPTICARKSIRKSAACR